jgi:hypothetical protein
MAQRFIDGFDYVDLDECKRRWEAFENDEAQAGRAFRLDASQCGVWIVGFNDNGEPDVDFYGPDGQRTKLNINE